MKDEKEIKNDSEQSNPSLESMLDKTGDYNEEQLYDELEKLAETFKNELKKASENGEVKVSENEIVDENDNIIPEEELCKCCGEKRRDTSVSENYEYCSECRELMKHYPLNFASVVIALAIIFVSVLSVTIFAGDFAGYNYARTAKEHESKNEKFSAVEYYDSAINFFAENEVVPKKLYKDSSSNVFATLPEGVRSFYEVSERIDEALSDFEAKLPIYNGYQKLRNQSLLMYNTFNAFYSILNNTEYMNFDPEDKETIGKIYNEIGALADKEVTITSMSGEKMTLTYDRASVLFSQFMFAYSYDEFEKAYDCLVELNEIAPEFISMYGYEFAIIEIQYGNMKNADALAEKLVLNNAEDSSPYAVFSYSERMKGNLSKSVKQADKGLAIDEENPDLYRQKAIAMLLDGDKKGALEVMNSGEAYGEYGVMYYTHLIIASEAGDKDKVSEINAKIKELNAETPEKVQRYLDGELSYKKLFTEGTGDIE
ncbi:MAG: hypothetical protein IKC01_00345 [Clostridia bacterium]|nr:hypothetical protein [Clostridia bacterium]